VKASCKNALRKPDAGNLHVRFDEGEGTRPSLALPLIPCVPLYSTPDFSSIHQKETKGNKVWMSILLRAGFQHGEGLAAFAVEIEKDAAFGVRFVERLLE